MLYPVQTGFDILWVNRLDLYLEAIWRIWTESTSGWMFKYVLLCFLPKGFSWVGQFNCVDWWMSSCFFQSIQSILECSVPTSNLSVCYGNHGYPGYALFTYSYRSYLFRMVTIHGKLLNYQRACWWLDLFCDFLLALYLGLTVGFCWRTQSANLVWVGRSSIKSFLRN